jgi:hypothetical protein
VSLTFSNGLCNEINSSVVLVGGNFVTNQMPNALLDIEFWVIGRQVLHFDVGMGVKKLPDSFALMPGSSIDIEIDFGFAHSVAEVF